MDTDSKASSTLCEDVPKFLSSFVDAFVDFSVSGGLFLPDDPCPPDCGDSSDESPPSQAPLRTRYPTPPDRLVAIGDLHGDLEKSKQAFRLANLIDGSDRWIGGSTTVVQVGDVLDRGGDELKILYFLEKLKRQAARSGGTLITMNGNHEIMNVEGDFRCVTKDALDEFVAWADWYRVGQVIKGLCKGLEKPKDLFDGIPLYFPRINNKDEGLVRGLRARIAALRPGGPISCRFFSQNVTALVVGDSVFVHGGLLPEHVQYGLEKINEEARDWINGLGEKVAPGHCKGRNAVVWLRKFSQEPICDCAALEHVLATIPGARRMIMGHSIQDFGINGVCNNQAIRIDVGMSKGCRNGLPEVLEITRNSEVRILTSNPMFENKDRASLHREKKEGLGLLIPEHGPKQVEVKA